MTNEWPVVRIVGTDEEANLIAGYLQNQEIPAKVESLLFHQEPVNFGRMGEVRIHVAPEYEEQARRLLEQLDREKSPAEVGEDARRQGDED